VPRVHGAGGIGVYAERRDKMSYKYGVVHAVIGCEDCGWVSKNYKNAQATAKIHAKTYGHRVEGELGISIVYDYHGTKGEDTK
jgi:hypothetical protein